MNSTRRKVLFATVALVGAWLVYGSIQHRWDCRSQNGSLLSELQHTKVASIGYVTKAEGWGYIYSNSVQALGLYNIPGFAVEGLFHPESSERDRRMLSLLRQCSGLHSTPPTPQESGGFVIVPDFPGWNGPPSGGVPHYAYISATGELGRGHEWVYVPKEFKEWMDSLKPVRPTPPKFTGIIVQMPPPPPWAGYVYGLALPALFVLVIFLAWLQGKPKQPAP